MEKSRHKIKLAASGRSVRIQRPQLIDMIRRILDEECPAEAWRITVIFVDKDRIIELNRQFFQKDEPTDVIAFDLSDDERHREGEIYICVDTAAENAAFYGVTLENELFRLAAHGALHLAGYDDGDADSRKQMTALENKALEYVFGSL
ncbi:MAG: rRNA maturation RNase YbeY [candidate division KSB1 bacterium]|nr:rRNA maturation RNase YbeY [candidate division KSB1 bacterium]